MNNKVNISVFLVLALLLVVSFFTFNLNANASTLGQERTKKFYSYTDPSTGKVVESNGDAPVYIQFNPGTTEYSSYVDLKFWRRTHNGIVHYSPIPPEQLITSGTNRDLSRLMENRKSHTFSVNRSDFFKTPFINPSNPSTLPNLKRGKSVLVNGKEQYAGHNTGSTYINGKLSGVNLKGNYEWRYIGYTAEGEPVMNPTFPSDYIGKFGPNDRHVYEKPWERFNAKGDLIVDNTKIPESMSKALHQTQFDRHVNKKQWLIDYFFKHEENKHWLLPAQPGETHLHRIDRTAGYYKDRFTLKGDPRDGSASLVMLHKTAGNIYVFATSTVSPPEPNIRIVLFEVVDPDTNQVLGAFRRSGTNNDDLKEIISYRKSEEPVLVPGKSYKMRAVVKNMIVKDLNGKPTTHQPLGLDLKLAKDEDIDKENQYFFQRTAGKNGSGSPRDGMKALPYGKDVYFDETFGAKEWMFTVPQDNVVKKEMKVRVELPVGFYLKQENLFTEDDYAELVFPVEKDDIGVSPEAELVDRNGNIVDEIEEGMPYSLRFTIDKPLGETPVGDPKNLKENPFASLSVKVTDGVKTRTYTPTTNKTMKLGDKVVVEIPSAIVPESTSIEAEWQIRQVHRDLGQSTIYNNDGPYKQKWGSDVNISVKNFHVSPKVVHRELGEQAGSERFTVRADIMNSNPTGKSKDIDIIVRQGSKSWKFVETIPANHETHFSADLGEIDLTYGNIPFEIEVNYPNPSKRKWIESKMDGSNPYLDNIAYKSVLVRENQLADKCETVHTRNDWKTTYTLTHYTYKWISQTCTDEDGGSYDCSYCKTTNVNSWTETRDHYETYNIDKVLFKSKYTEDNGDGWVDILKNPSAAVVKAGYGFELKYEVVYTTNVTNVPDHWGKTGCDGTKRTIRGTTEGKSISIPAIPVYSPTVLNVEMPYTDESGEKVKYKLNGTATGHWTNRRVKFEMPMRDAVSGQGSNRKIYVNETARDDTHTIRIDTQEFAGTHEKRHPGINLCDTKHIDINILGANSDDVNTHITQ